MAQIQYVNDLVLQSLGQISPKAKDAVNISHVEKPWQFEFKVPNSGFKMVTSGVEYYTIDHTTYELKPGHVLWVNQGDVVLMENKPNTAGLCINISPKTLHEFHDSLGYKSPQQIASGLLSPLLFNDASFLLKQSWSRSFQVLQQLQDTLQVGTTRLPQKRHYAGIAIAKRMQDAVKLMEQEKHFEKDLQFFSQEVGMSHFHFCRCFTAFFGFSPKKHHNQVKLTHAKAQVISGASFGALHEYYGYSDYTAFSRAFKAMHGAAPKKIAINAK